MKILVNRKLLPTYFRVTLSLALNSPREVSPTLNSLKEVETIVFFFSSIIISSDLFRGIQDMVLSTVGHLGGGGFTGFRGSLD